MNFTLNINNLKAFGVAILLILGACETTDLDLRQSPNSLTPEQGSIDFLLTSTQFSFAAGFFNTAQFFGSEVTRQRQMIGPTYQAAYSPQSFNGLWTNAYANVLVENRNIANLATEQELYTHAGIAQLLSAYTLITLVDYFGDVPWSEALDDTNFNPPLDSGQSVYMEALNLIDEALANFALDELAQPEGDLIYGGDEEKWIKMANSLKLKAYLNMSKVSDLRAESINQINLLISSGNLISDIDDNFEFQYSSNRVDPDSRHPDYVSDFEGDPGEYMSNYMMWVMLEQRDIVDPRIRFYFYRQDPGLPTNTSDLACLGEEFPSHYPNPMAFCTVGDNYYGRDHGRSEGVPPDSEIRTVWGSYPVGAAFDDDRFTPVGEGDGLAGAGLEPMIMNFTVDFWLAESALTNGTSGSAAAYLESGIRNSFAVVSNYVDSDANPDMVPGSDEFNEYVEFVMEQYNNASSDDERLFIIAKEFWIATFGNGVEAYNLYRRTGMPNDMQPTVISDPGEFFRSFLYPSDVVTLNSSVSQKASVAEQVFWDTNPAGFID